MSAPRVLVVDDNAMNIELVEFVLRADAFEVVTAASADAAVEALTTYRPDLILMDIQMPGLSGVELMQKIRAWSTTRDIVIVAFTAFAMKGDEARFIAEGFDAYLGKPIDVATFGDSVRRLLR